MTPKSRAALERLLVGPARVGKQSGVHPMTVAFLVSRGLANIVYNMRETGSTPIATITLAGAALIQKN